MKKRIPTFVAGMVTMALISSIGISTLAATGKLTIEVNPINVQVNGEVFKPKDATGKDVPVFNYGGTAYAPLRALAEAYGLEVGYDAGKNMATVGEKGSTTTPTTPTTPDKPTGDYSDWTAEEEKAYQEFKGMWDVDTSRASETGVKLTVKSSITKNDFVAWLTKYNSTASEFGERYSNELIKEYVFPLLEAQHVYNSFTSYYYSGILLWQQSKMNFDVETDAYSINESTYDLKIILQQLQ